MTKTPVFWDPSWRRIRLPLTLMILCLLAAVASLVSACSNSNHLSEPQTQPAPAVTAPSPKPSPSDEYLSAQHLVAALNTAGVPCLNWEQTDNPIDALDLGSCYVGEDEIVAATYNTHEEAASEPDYKAALLEGVSDVNVVVGGKWTFSCDTTALCQQIVDKFGGELVTIPM
jgi:hypothetical protein